MIIIALLCIGIFAAGWLSCWLGVRRYNQRCPVDGEALLREATYANLAGTTALIFARTLSHRELVAIERAWKARPPMPTVPMAELDPGAYDPR